MEEELSEKAEGFDRRKFLRKAGVTGVLVAWSAPVFQSVALAQTTGSPAPETTTETTGDGTTAETTND